jgi:endoglucanase
MKKKDTLMVRSILLVLFGLFVCAVCVAQNVTTNLILNDLGYFEKRGLNVLVFSNCYEGLFSDAKMSGVEIIHHGVRTATNGDVRLSPTPGQWDPIPRLIERNVDKESKSIEVHLTYPDHDFSYEIRAQAQDDGILLSVLLPKPIPQSLEGRAGFNLEFLPSAYFEKTYLVEDKGGAFPLYPTGSMETTKWGTVEPRPLTSGRSLILAPEDPVHRVAIESRTGDLLLYDGQNLAQNGWFVFRTLLPAGKSGNVLEWFLKAHSIPNWTRTPVIEHSQVGYVLHQKKVAIIELDKSDRPQPRARLLKVNGDGSCVDVYNGDVNHWGEYLRYNYFTFDFSSVQQPG